MAPSRQAACPDRVLRLGPTPKQPPPPLPLGGDGGYSIVLCGNGDWGKPRKRPRKFPFVARVPKKMGKNIRKLRLSKGLTEYVRVTIWTQELQENFYLKQGCHLAANGVIVLRLAWRYMLNHPIVLKNYDKAE